MKGLLCVAILVLAYSCVLYGQDVGNGYNYDSHRSEAESDETSEKVSTCTCMSDSDTKLDIQVFECFLKFSWSVKVEICSLNEFQNYLLVVVFFWGGDTFRCGYLRLMYSMMVFLREASRIFKFEIRRDRIPEKTDSIY